jgi:hypothetical protein
VGARVGAGLGVVAGPEISVRLHASEAKSRIERTTLIRRWRVGFEEEDMRISLKRERLSI